MVQRVKTTVLHFLFPVCLIVPYCCLLLSFVLKSWGDGALSSGCSSGVLRVFFGCFGHSSGVLRVFFRCSSGVLRVRWVTWGISGCSSGVLRMFFG